MNLTLNAALLEKLAEGVIVLGNDGRVTDFNRAAVPWIKPCQERAAEIDALIRQIVVGEVQAPVSIAHLFRASSANADIYLCKSGPKSFAVLIATRQAGPAAIAPPQDKYQSLLGEDFRHELSDLRQLLDQDPAHNGPQTSPLQKKSNRLSRLLVAMEQLCELQRSDIGVYARQESLQTMVQEVIADLPTRRGDYSINTELSSKPDTQGTLYGHVEWLKVAIKGLLLGIGEGAPTDCQVEIRVRQNGGFSVMTGNFSSAFSKKKSAPVPETASDAILSTAADIRLAICQRIVALHGGQLRVVGMEANTADRHPRGIESFTLTLPTGAPPQGHGLVDCAKCLYPQQAELYAQDLAFLLPRQPVGAKVSKEELECISRITTSAATYEYSNAAP